MNLPILATILGEFPLKKIYGSSKIIKKVNELILDEQYHINSDMTGFELTLLYRELEELELHDSLLTTEVVSETESIGILDKIESLRAINTHDGTIANQSKQLIVVAMCVSLAVFSIVACGLYHINSVSLKVNVNSNIISVFARLVSEYREVETTGTIVDPGDLIEYEQTPTSSKEETEIGKAPIE